MPSLQPTVYHLTIKFLCLYSLVLNCLAFHLLFSSASRTDILNVTKNENPKPKQKNPPQQTQRSTYINLMILISLSSEQFTQTALHKRPLGIWVLFLGLKSPLDCWLCRGSVPLTLRMSLTLYSSILHQSCLLHHPIHPITHPGFPYTH